MQISQNRRKSYVNCLRVAKKRVKEQNMTVISYIMDCHEIVARFEPGTPCTSHHICYHYAMVSHVNNINFVSL